MFATKFGLKGYFYIQQLSFRAIGFEINSTKRTFERPYLAGILGALFTLLMISWIDEICRNKNDNLNELTEALLPFFHTSTVIYKIFTFICKHKRIMQLVEHIWNMTEKANAEQRLIVAAENDIERKFSVFYYTGIMSLFVLTSVLPHFVSISIYMRTGSLQQLVPLELSTPFDQNYPLFYFATACWLAGGMYFICCCTTSMDTLYCWFVFNIAAQFRVLQQHFKNAASASNPADMGVAICSCIEKHQRIIALAHDFDRAFKQIIFVEFSINGLQTCLLAYQLSGSSVPLEKFILLAVFLCVMLFQFMIYCYGGQRIQDESSKVANDIYEAFPWHNVSDRNKKLMLLSLLRAQKQCNVTGIFFVADWQLFEWVIKLTYSMLTMLRSVGTN